MALTAHRQLLRGTAIPLRLGQVGCATHGVRVPTPSVEVRARLGTIGLVSTTSKAQVKVWTRFREALERACQGLARQIARELFGAEVSDQAGEGEVR